MMFRNIANYFPQSIASTIVKCHHSYLPGSISHKWLENIEPNSNLNPFVKWLGYNLNWFQMKKSTTTNRNRVKYFTITSIFLSLLQRLGAINSFLQRMIIHILQPIIFLFLLSI